MSKPVKMPKHGKAFAREYTKNGNNALKAAQSIKSISPSSANKTATRLSQNAAVKAEIARLEKTANEKADESAIIDRNRIIREWNKIAFRNAKTIYNSADEMKSMRKLSEEDAACIAEVMELQTEIGHSRKVKFFSKEAALKELSKLGGLYPEEGTGEAVRLIFQFGGVQDGHRS